MHKGWVKLWRKSLRSPVFQSDALWRLFSYCLMMADHEPYQAIFGGKATKFPAGTFITGRLILAETMGCPPSTAWGRLTKCIELGLIDTKSDNHRTVITICNWNTYQQNGEAVPTGEPTTNRQPTDNQPTLPKELKKERTEEVTPVAHIPLKGGDQYPVTARMVAEYRETYPYLDVEAELRKAVQWCRDNPGRCKTRKGVRKFLGGWMGRAEPPDAEAIPDETPASVYDAYVKFCRSKRALA